MKCGLLLEGPRKSTIQAARLAMKACKTEQKATAALEQALALLTSQAAPGAKRPRSEEKASEEKASEEKAAAEEDEEHKPEDAEEQEDDTSKPPEE